jgi:polyphosphate glucokinase
MGKHDAEHRAADSVREELGLSWKDWSARVEEYLVMVEALFTPDLFVIGGGVSKKSEKFFPYLGRVQTEVVAAQLLNEAGIVGAALAHAQRAGVPHTD